MCADQLHGERLLCSQYVQEGARVASPVEQVAEQTVRMSGVSIRNMAAVLNPSTTQSLDIGQQLQLVGVMACSYHIVTCHVCNISLECIQCAYVHYACTACAECLHTNLMCQDVWHKPSLVAMHYAISHGQSCV